MKFLNHFLRVLISRYFTVFALMQHFSSHDYPQVTYTQGKTWLPLFCMESVLSKRPHSYTSTHSTLGSFSFSVALSFLLEIYLKFQNLENSSSLKPLFYFNHPPITWNCCTAKLLKQATYLQTPMISLIIPSLNSYNLIYGFISTLTLLN